MHSCTRACTASTKRHGKCLGCSCKRPRQFSQDSSNPRAHAYMQTCTRTHTNSHDCFPGLFFYGCRYCTLLLLRSTPGKTESPLGPALLAVRRPTTGTGTHCGFLIQARRPSPLVPTDDGFNESITGGEPYSSSIRCGKGTVFQVLFLVRGCQANNLARCSSSAMASLHSCLVSSVFTWDILTDPRTKVLLEP